MSIGRWRPFGAVERDAARGMSDLQSEMNRLFDGFFGRRASPQAGGSWTPAVDVRETKDEFVFTVEVPGVHQKDVSVSVTGDLLTIKGERRFDERPAETWLHVERAHGKFERTIQIPTSVQADKVRATYRDGLLEVMLPKAEEIKPREIQVDIA
jgi:HSP20 family protein